ncbi:MAG: helix-turn-helix transcriptional regulator [Gammaproteobacteria bacterium]|nr:helix-turn-helix transcriptional regulator [Gammaproteobacteria bacterium]
MLIARKPGPALQPFVKSLWVKTLTNLQPSAAGAREHVVPTGDIHLVIRLDDVPLRLFNGATDVTGYTVSNSIVGGARSAFYIRDISTPSSSVGAQLYPGVAEILFGTSAAELSERHTGLDDLWGSAAGLAREQLLEAANPERQLAVFEELLTARLPVENGMHPVIAYAIEQFAAARDVHTVVQQSGYSHRHFIALFRRDMGLSPKTYHRLRRFQRVLAGMAGPRVAAWADFAADYGYSDHAHFHREFREFAGVTPEAYRKIAPVFTHHVAIDPAKPPRA